MMPIRPEGELRVAVRLNFRTPRFWRLFAVHTTVNDRQIVPAQSNRRLLSSRSFSAALVARSYARS
jgi:hypothetical protein